MKFHGANLPGIQRRIALQVSWDAARSSGALPRRLATPGIADRLPRVFERQYADAPVA